MGFGRLHPATAFDQGSITVLLLGSMEIREMTVMYSDLQLKKLRAAVKI
jgi:hypothetical protein